MSSYTFVQSFSSSSHVVKNGEKNEFHTESFSRNAEMKLNGDGTFSASERAHTERNGKRSNQKDVAYSGTWEDQGNGEKLLTVADYKNHLHCHALPENSNNDEHHQQQQQQAVDANNNHNSSNNDALVAGDADNLQGKKIKLSSEFDLFSNFFNNRNNLIHHFFSGLDNNKNKNNNNNNNNNSLHITDNHHNDSKH